MNELTIDFESRSEAELKGSNPWVYAEHPSTQIICLSMKWKHGPSDVYIPDPHFQELIPYGYEHNLHRDSALIFLRDADIIEAHNIGFELALWETIMVKQYGFPSLLSPEMFVKLRCSASVCGYLALPRALGAACAVMGVAVQKDAEGHKLMMKMCKPRRPRKAEKEANPDWENTTYWWEEPEQVLRLCEYCCTDTDAEYSLSQVIGSLSEKELEVWRIDLISNMRGVRIDPELVDRMVAIRDAYMAESDARFFEITGFSPTCTAQLRDWAGAQGYPMPSVAKDAITEALEDTAIPDIVREALTLRQGFAKTSLAKLDAARTCTSADLRMRDILMYCAANTHRWGGKGMQLQNIPSRCLIPAIDAFRHMVMSGMDLATLRIMYPEDIQLALSSLLRNVVIATPGMTLYASDFSAIEGRNLAWVAKEEHVLQAYRDGLDLYKVSAAGIHGIGYDDVDSTQRSMGKIAELAGGYRGWWRAYMHFAVGYNMKPPQEIIDSLTPEDFEDWDGTILNEKEAAHMKWWLPTVKGWRADRPKTCKLWYAVEDAAVNAIQHPGQVFHTHGLQFGFSRHWLRILLPSGNVLYYRDANVYFTQGENKAKIRFKGTDSSKGGAWVTKYTHGGKLTENIIQSLSRDMMAEALVRIVRADTGLQFLFSVHDELIFEGRPGLMTLEEYNAMMAVPPEWAQDCPIEADGWLGDRYRK